VSRQLGKDKDINLGCGSENQSYSKDKRLLVSSQFNNVFLNPDFKLHANHMFLLGKWNSLSTARLGLVMSKRNAGNAVSRNRLKRLSREAFRRYPAEFATIDIVLVSKSGLMNLDNASYLSMVNDLFDKLCKKVAHQSTKQDT
jgi:ribonuclease P protein component